MDIDDSQVGRGPRDVAVVGASGCDVGSGEETGFRGKL